MKSIKYSEKLSSLRNEKNLTQKDVWSSLEIPSRTYESWEMGEKEPSEWTQKLVLDAIENLEANKVICNDCDGEYHVPYDLDEVKHYFIDWNLLKDFKNDSDEAFNDFLEYMIELQEATTVEDFLDTLNRETDRYGNGTEYFVYEH